MELDSLCQYVAGRLELYVMNGKVSPALLANAIAEAAFGEEISQFEDLLLLHYLLEEETVEFATQLPARIRSLRTGTDTQTEQVRAEVDSRIDWQATVRERYGRNPDDPTLFVTQSRNEEYDLDENIVLKALLERLDAGLDIWGSELEQYGWRGWGSQHQDGTANEGVLARTARLIATNAHVDRIREPKRVEPTARMLETARRSRHRLYTEAAERYIQHESIVNETPDRELLEELLRETLIVPLEAGDTKAKRYSTLFELYVLFQVIDALSSVLGVEAELSPITRGRNAVAEFQLLDGDSIRVYYEQAARNERLSFLGSTTNVSRGDLSPRELIQRRTSDITSSLPGLSTRLSTDRPDVLVVYVRDGKILPAQTLLAEVKYQGPGSAGQGTIKRGVREVLEYISYMRYDGKQVAPRFPHKVGPENIPSGILAINDLDEEFEGQRFDEVELITASGLEATLPYSIERWIGSIPDTHSV